MNWKNSRFASNGPKDNVIFANWLQMEPTFEEC